MTHPAPSLLIQLPTGERRVSAGSDAVVLGRDPLCPISLDHPQVSREHLAIEHRDGRWYVRDLGSSNGTYLEGDRISVLEVSGPCAVRLGDDGPEIGLRPGTADPAPPADPPNAGRAPTARHAVETRVRVGRAPDNTIPLDDLLVSRHHAELTRVGDELRVTDLGSSNGTFVNGRRVRTAALHPGDRVSFGHHQMAYDGRTLQEYVDDGRVHLRAEELTVRVGGRTLLAGVSFAVDECNLVAVVGPSGAGKSTLLNSLTGIRPASEGTVRYDGRDLYRDYDDLRHRIGLVPQDDILHRPLTVRRALRYAAALRFAADVTPAERNARVDAVLAQLGLTAHAEQRISTLSGGQRKRTSVALELLTEPSLLFLDEPTSGLDPALDRDVMVALRALADRGRTVVVVTHSTLHLDVCDRVLVLGRGGRVAYFGPPDRLLEFFGAPGYADVFEAVAAEPDRWADRFAATAPPVRRPDPVERPRTAPPPSPVGRWRQLGVLTHRGLALLLADRLHLALTLGMPLGLALLLRVIPGSDGLAAPAGPAGRSAEAAQLLVVLVVGAVFLGLAGGIRELVRERPIYRRERAVGLSPGAYLASKLLVFAVLAVPQALLFVLAGLLGRPGAEEALVLGSPTAEIVAVIWLTILTCGALGLLVSAFVTTSEQTMPLLVGLVMTQLVFCGGLFAVVGREGIEQLSWLTPARWAYAATAATVDLRSSQPDPAPDALWRHSPGAWWWAVSVLAFQCAVLTSATRGALRRHEPGRGSR